MAFDHDNAVQQGFNRDIDNNDWNVEARNLEIVLEDAYGATEVRVVDAYGVHATEIHSDGYIGTRGEVHVDGGRVVICDRSNEDTIMIQMHDRHMEPVGIYSLDGDPNGLVTGYKGSLGLDHEDGYLYINNDGATTWTRLVGAGEVVVPTLHQAYKADPDGGDATITTDATDGWVVIAGTEGLKVTGTKGFDLDTGFDMDGAGPFDVDITGAVSIDSDAASNFTVDSNNLTLRTTTSGTVTVDGADGVILDGNGSDVIPATDDQDSLGDSTHGWTTVYLRNIGDTGTIALNATGGAGAPNTTAGADAVGTNDTNFDTFGPLMDRDSVQGALEAIDGYFKDLTDYIDDTADSITLQRAYDNDPDGGDATITTNATDGWVVIAGDQGFRVTATQGFDLNTQFDMDGAGPFDVDITGAVSIDSDAASNVTVDGANLTLSTINSGDVKITVPGGSGDFVVDDGTNEYIETFTSINELRLGDDAYGDEVLVRVKDDLIVEGDLYVNGDETVLNTEQLYVEDRLVRLNIGAPAGFSGTTGIEMELGSDGYAEWHWDDTQGRWELSIDRSVTPENQTFRPIPYLADSPGTLDLSSTGTDGFPTAGPNPDAGASVVNSNATNFPNTFGPDMTDNSVQAALEAIDAYFIEIGDDLKSYTTLQIAYDNDVDGANATINTNATDGFVVIAGTQGLRVTAATGLDLDTGFDMDGAGPFDVDITGGVSIDADSGSNFTVEGADLDLETTTSGDINISAAAEVDIDAGTTVVIDATNGVSIDAGAASNFTTSSGALTLDGAGGMILDGNGNNVIPATSCVDTLGDSTHGWITAYLQTVTDGYVVGLTDLGTSGETNLHAGACAIGTNPQNFIGTFGIDMTDNTVQAALEAIDGYFVTQADLIESGFDTLHTAYKNDIDGGDATITTDATDGWVVIAGDQGFRVTATQGFDLNTQFDMDGAGPFDVDITGAVSIDSDTASNITVDGANLDLETTSAGDVNISAAGEVDIDSGTDVVIDAIDGVSIDAGAASNFTVDGANLDIETTTSGDVNVSAAGEVDIDSGTDVVIDATDGVSIDAGAASNFTTSSGALTLDGNGGVVLEGNGNNVIPGTDDQDSLGDATHGWTTVYLRNIGDTNTVALNAVGGAAAPNTTAGADTVGTNDTNFDTFGPLMTRDSVQGALEAIDGYFRDLTLEDLDTTYVKEAGLELNGAVLNGNIKTSMVSGTPSLNFKKNKTGRASWTIPVPTDWDGTSDIEVEVIWSAEDASAGNVEWRLEYKALSLTELASGASTTDDYTQAASGTADELQGTGGNLAISAGTVQTSDDIIVINVVRRGTAGGDTYAKDAQVHLVKYRYTAQNIV
jgi:hypothetical protein